MSQVQTRVKSAAFNPMIGASERYEGLRYYQGVMIDAAMAGVLRAFREHGYFPNGSTIEQVADAIAAVVSANPSVEA